MVRKMLLITALALMAAGAAAQEEQGVEQAFQELRSAYLAAETPQEQVDIFRNFLARFPESRYTVSVLGAGTRLLANELENAEGALELVESVHAAVSDADIRFEVLKLKARFLGNLGRTEDFLDLVAELSVNRALDLNDLHEIAASAVDAGAWDLILELSDGALQMATPQAFRALYPGRQSSEERVREWVNSTVGLIHTFKGWALSNLGHTEEALAAFGVAEEKVYYFYLGFPEDNLHLYLGRTLMGQRDYEGAIEKLAPGAILGGRDDELEALREAYAALNGGDDGFDEYVAETRRSIAVPADDFTLPDYDGGQLTLSSLRGRVVLLAFWFPT